MIIATVATGIVADQDGGKTQSDLMMWIVILGMSVAPFMAGLFIFRGDTGDRAGAPRLGGCGVV
jgi:hypothetical protein